MMDDVLFLFVYDLSRSATIMVGMLLCAEQA